MSDHAVRESVSTIVEQRRAAWLQDRTNDEVFTDSLSEYWLRHLDTLYWATREYKPSTSWPGVVVPQSLQPVEP
jgi:hypothetical protein